MYCSNCGAAATGNFCSQCGASLAAPAPVGDWRQEVRYEALLRFAEVRDLIAAHAAQAKRGISGEQFVELCDKVLSPLTGVPLNVVTTIALPIYEHLGIRTGKKRAEFLKRPPGEVIVAALCSLGRMGQKVKAVQQATDCCGLHAELPSDLRSMTGGELRITLRRQEHGTVVEAATHIPGQLYDWGKSNQALTQLFDDLLHLPYVEATIVPRVA